MIELLPIYRDDDVLQKNNFQNKKPDLLYCLFLLLAYQALYDLFLIIRVCIFKLLLLTSENMTNIY